MGLLSSHGGIRNSGDGQGLSYFVVVAADSGLRWLVLLGNRQCGVGQRWEMVLAASALWDELACTGLQRVAQLY